MILERDATVSFLRTMEVAGSGRIFAAAASGQAFDVEDLASAYIRFANGASLVMTAFAGTGAVFFGMAVLSSVIKRDLSNMGKFLFVGAIVVLIAGIINAFVQSSALMLTLSVICVGLFSAFMLYDIKRIIDGGETNYITATLAIYLDIYNVFQSLLSLLGIFGSDD